MMIDLEQLTVKVCHLARKTGIFLASAGIELKKEDILEKSDNNFVTWVDTTSEIKLVEGLKEILPGSGFIAEEETTGNQELEYTWIIDPLDGTTNYIHGVPVYCISIGLMYKGSIILGVIYEVNFNECFYAWKGGGAYLNDKRISVSGTSTLKKSLLATGFPYYDYNRLDQYIELFKYLMQHSHGIRRLGSAAADMAWVACGRFDGFYEYGLSSWDVAAGSLIISEAGGRVADFKGEGNYLFGKEIIACNDLIFNELRLIVRQFFSNYD